MDFLAFIKNKFFKIKNRFDVQKVPVMMKKNLESMAYLKKI